MLTESDNDWLAENYPGLHPDDLGISGTIAFTASYDAKTNIFRLLDRVDSVETAGIVITGQFDIHIKKREPSLNSELPGLYIDGIDSTEKRHFDQSNGSACLCSPFDEAEFLKPRFDFKEYLEKLVIPFLYGQAFYTQKQKWPWLERAHGPMGIIESYPSSIDRGNVEKCLRHLQGNTALWRRILSALRQKAPLKGNMQCFCGRRVRIKKCHPEALAGAIRLRSDMKTLGIIS